MTLKRYILWNLGTVFLYWLQALAGWQWPWLLTQQEQTSFKQVSGLAILVFVFFQNTLFIVRSRVIWKNHNKQIYQLHFKSSVLSMPLLYIHTMKMGHQYTFLFSLLYSLNVLIASFAPKPLNIRSKKYQFYWMVSHVTLSTFVSFFIFFHIFMTFYFN